MGVTYRGLDAGSAGVSMQLTVASAAGAEAATGAVVVAAASLTEAVVGRESQSHYESTNKCGTCPRRPRNQQDGAFYLQPLHRSLQQSNIGFAHRSIPDGLHHAKPGGVQVAAVVMPKVYSEPAAGQGRFRYRWAALPRTLRR